MTIVRSSSGPYVPIIGSNVVATSLSCAREACFECELTAVEYPKALDRVAYRESAKGVPLFSAASISLTLGGIE